jgi:hypothetical protein
LEDDMTPHRRLRARDLAGLTQWSNVQLATRAAQRVLAFCVDRQLREIAKKAIAIAEAAASNGHCAPSDDDVESLRLKYETEAGTKARRSPSFCSSRAAFVAYHAACRPSVAVVCAREALYLAQRAITRPTKLEESAQLTVRFGEAVLADFATLSDGKARYGWQDSTPVPTSLFGPLWPGGMPVGWPKFKSAQIAAIPRSAGNCFVAMPFGGRSERYQLIYRPAIIDAGYTPFRGDESQRAGPVVPEIQEQLRGAAAILADLTDNNFNVAYEIGFAHALGKPVILVAPQDQIVPFDVRGERIIYYDVNIPNWGDRLREEIRYTLRPGGRNRSSS